MTTLSKARFRKKPRNRAAQEATLINLRALKRQVKALAARVLTLEHTVLRASQGPSTMPAINILHKLE